MFEALRPYLPEIWLAHMGFFLLFYAITDGIDLGVGIISIFSRNEKEVGTLMGSIRSNWHSNQTWLVILAGMLFGAFPIFYAVVFSALYIPLIAMLFGLIFRGVAFEFWDHSARRQRWGRSFGWGSLIVAVAQGMAFGTIMSGAVTIEGGDFSGSPWSWLNPFALLVTVGVVIGYAMLGANFLIMKTRGELQEQGYRVAWITSLAVLAIAAGVHGWSLIRFPEIAGKWVRLPWALPIGGLTLLAGIGFLALLLSLKQRREAAPVFLNAAVIVISFTALSFGYYPYMIPTAPTGGITVAQAAAASESLLFMLYVSAIALPVILAYTGYAYWAFRGKTEQEIKR